MTVVLSWVIADGNAGSCAPVSIRPTAASSEAEPDPRTRANSRTRPAAVDGEADQRASLLAACPRLIGIGLVRLEPRGNRTSPACHDLGTGWDRVGRRTGCRRSLIAGHRSRWC